MYHGEVNVAQEELNSFLSVAEELQVKGLTQNNSSANSTTKPDPPTPISRPRLPPRAPEAVQTPKRPRPAPVAPTPSQTAYQPSQPDDIQEIIPMAMPVVKTEPQPSTPLTSAGGGGEEVGMVDTMGTEVASMEVTYVEEGYDDYGEYEGQGYDGGDGQEGYAGQEYGADGQAGQTGENKFRL